MGKKKEKVIYYDDGRTVADMSAFSKGKAPAIQESAGSRLRDIWNTYWAATKMMFLPTLAICGGLAAMFALAYLIFFLAG